MHLSRRLIVSLLCGVAVISGIFALSQASPEVKSLKDQVKREASLVADNQRKAKALASGMAVGGFVKINGQPAYVYALPLPAEGAIAIMRETAWITAPNWRHGLASAAQTLLIAGITLLIVGWGLSERIAGRESDCGACGYQVGGRGCSSA